MENIQVAIRVRPLNKREVSRSDENIWDIPSVDTISLSNTNSKEYFASKKINCTGRTTFYFDHCFNPEQDNLQVYHQVAKRIVLSSLNGINGTIFMYGQTGSGKTYTMMGFNKHQEEEHDTSAHDRSISPFGRSLTPPTRQPSKKNFTAEFESYQSSEQSNKGNYIITDITENTGILVIALRDIFDTIENDMDKTYFLRCSYVEIYNDQIFDLLKTAERMNETLSVNEDAQKEFYIKGVTEESVSSIQDILEKLAKGEANRHYARTTMNHASSRSHTIFRLMVQSVTNNFIREYRRDKSKCGPNINNFELRTQFEETCDNKVKTEGTIVTESLLNFVDLAGSEKVSNHQMLLEDPGFMNVDQGGIYGRDSMLAASKLKERVKEGQHINKSLFFLTQVISLKSEGKSNLHIPYRNSPLTKILRSSLGGNSRTLIILCLTPAASQFEQTMSTLRFGMNAKKIENKIQANIITRDDDVGLRLLISDYEKKLKDAESARQEDQIKYANLLRQVEELQLHKNALIERLSSLCKSRVAKMAESIPEDVLSSFYNQMRQQYIYFNKVGVIFSSKALKKYEKIFAASASLGRPKKENLEQKTRIIEDQDFADSVNRENNEYRTKVEESLCNFYFKLFKSYKEQNKLLAKKLAILEKNSQTLCERSLSNYNNYLNVSAQLQARNKKLKEVVEGYKSEMERSKELQNKLELYRDLKGMEELKDEGLDEFEKHFWEKLDQIKMEKVKRMVLKGVSLTKNTTEEGLLNSEIEGKKEINLNLEDNEEQADQEAGIQLAKQEREEMSIKEILCEGIQNIDRELEINMKNLAEASEFLCSETREEEEHTRRTGRSFRVENGDRSERENLLVSFRGKTTARNEFGPENFSSKKRSPKAQTESFPKLDIGMSIADVVIETNLPKLSQRTVSAKKMSQTSSETPKAFQIEGETLTAQVMGPTEVKSANEPLTDRRDFNNNENIGVTKPEKALVSASPGIIVRENIEKALCAQDSNTVKGVPLGERSAEKAEKENNHQVKVTGNERINERVLSPVSASQANSNQDLSVLQSKLTKHLASLDKYMVKATGSGGRRPRSMRSDLVSVTQFESTTRATNDSFLTPKKSHMIMEGNGRRGRRFEEEYEFRDDSEGEHKMKVSKKSSQKNVIKMKEEEEPLPDKFALNITNIEKEETIFSTSMFSIKDFEGLSKDKDPDFGDNTVLKQLDNFYGKVEQELSVDSDTNSFLNDTRKRRRRADRVKAKVGS